jgi:CRISPR-associated DxTHG motif protein
MKKNHSSASREQKPPHILLTVLGTNPREATYELNNKTAQAALAPLALMALLPPEQQPDKIIALCTNDALQESWPILRDSLPSSCSAEAVEIQSSDSQDGINDFLVETTKAIPSPNEGRLQLSIDVTHGFRHFAFLTYIAGLYLVSLRDIKLSGAWYGLLQREKPSPFLDLKPLLELPTWIHALQVLRHTGSALPLAKAVRDGKRNSSSAEIAKHLSRISKAFLSGLPLELGDHVQRLLAPEAVDKVDEILDGHKLPLSIELRNQLLELLEPFKIEKQEMDETWKSGIPLDSNELQRQSLFINRLLDHKDEATALGLLREWTISWALLNQNDKSNWLDKNLREQVSRKLSAIKEAYSSKQLSHFLTDDQKELGKFWEKLTSLRNGFHHHGMRPQVMIHNINRQVPKDIERVKSYWRDTLQACPRFSLNLGDGSDGTLLISPFGTSPGLLYSALLACQDRTGAPPAKCLVICSKTSVEMIDESARRAKFPRENIIPLMLEDPYGGTGEFKRLKEEAGPFCSDASEVLVNVTGGTTVMGLAAQELESLAKESFARPVQRFGLIDRRPPDLQKAKPYERGEAFWLSNPSE